MRLDSKERLANVATTMFLMNQSWRLSLESEGKLHSVHAQSLEKGERTLVMPRIFITVTVVHSLLFTKLFVAYR